MTLWFFKTFYNVVKDLDQIFNLYDCHHKEKQSVMHITNIYFVERQGEK